MKEPEIALSDVPEAPRKRMPASWARDTRFYLCMVGLFARRFDTVFRWTGRGWKECKVWPDAVPRE